MFGSEGRFRIRLRRRSKGQFPLRDEQQAYEVASSPERLMVAITNTMAECVNSPDEFGELTALLISKAPAWVKGVVKQRDHNAAVERSQRPKPPPLTL